MPLFIAALVGALVSAAGTLVGQILVSLGIGYVSYTAIDTSIGWAKAFTVQHLQSVGAANTLAVMGALHIGQCISILSSALVVRMTLKGMTSGAIKRMVVK